MSRQRVYATLLALGAAILLYRTISMVAQGALDILVIWVGALLIIELVLDAGCILSAGYWWAKNNRKSARLPLRLGATATILHAFRVLIFVMGRTGPWIDFDVRPEHRALQYTRWSWTGVYIAAILSVLGLVGVYIIWKLRRRKRA